MCMRGWDNLSDVTSLKLRRVSTNPAGGFNSYACEPTYSGTDEGNHRVIFTPVKAILYNIHFGPFSSRVVKPTSAVCVASALALLTGADRLGGVLCRSAPPGPSYLPSIVFLPGAVDNIVLNEFSVLSPAIPTSCVC